MQYCSYPISICEKRFVCMCVYVLACMYVCMYACIHASMYVCMYVRAYICRPRRARGLTNASECVCQQRRHISQCIYIYIYARQCFHLCMQAGTCRFQELRQLVHDPLLRDTCMDVCCDGRLQVDQRRNNCQ